MWYVIDGTLYCPDCVPVIADGEETAAREVSTLHNKALTERAQEDDLMNVWPN